MSGLVSAAVRTAVVAAACMLSTGIDLAAQSTPPLGAVPSGQHAGGEANLVLPDLGTVDFQGITDERY